MEFETERDEIQADYTAMYPQYQAIVSLIEDSNGVYSWGIKLRDKTTYKIVSEFSKPLECELLHKWVLNVLGYYVSYETYTEPYDDYPCARNTIEPMNVHDVRRLITLLSDMIEGM